RYFDAMAPWQLQKEGKTDRLNTVLNVSLEAIRVAASLLQPVMPNKMKEIRKDFGVLFQNVALFGSMNIYDNVALPLRERTDASEDEIRAGLQVDDLECFGTLTGEVDQPLFTFVGRMSQQKGVDLLLEVVESLVHEELQPQMIFLGKGDPQYEDELIRMTSERAMHGRVCFFRGFNPEFANRIYAAGDFFVVPSRYEPCGLTDFIAQLFGNVPIVHHVGGLVKVINNVTGLAFRKNLPGGIIDAFKRALLLYEDKPRLRQIQLEAVREITRHYTWEKVKDKYLQLYRRAKVLQVNKQ
ncbi:MAG: glycosyltransferase, partial [Desulforhopalus sp.]